jgi:hypothetical protein
LNFFGHAVVAGWTDNRAFSKLRTRLALWGAPRDYAEPPFVLARVTDALRRRPALAVLEEQSARVAEYLPSFQQRVERHAAELLIELENALGSED